MGIPVSAWYLAQEHMFLLQRQVLIVIKGETGPVHQVLHKSGVEFVIFGVRVWRLVLAGQHRHAHQW